MDTAGRHTGNRTGGVGTSGNHAPVEEGLSDTGSIATVGLSDSVDDFLENLDEGTEPSLEPALSSDASSANAPSLSSISANRFSQMTFSDTSSTVAPTIPSLSSKVTNVASLASAGAFYSKHLDSQPYRIYSVRTFCESLLKSARVDDARIMSVERYGDLHGVPHRFLILHVVRTDGRDFYLRLDRRRDHSVPLRIFAVRDLGTSAAVDTAAISGRHEHLLDYTNKKSGVEAVMIFPTLAPLTAVAQILYAIATESPEYKLTKDNCWFFASTIQEMLILRFGAQYQSGSLNHPNIGADRRNPIRLMTYAHTTTEIGSILGRIQKFAALVADSRLTEAVKSVLNVIKNCYQSADDIFSAPDAPLFVSSTRGSLFALHQALHEHLHACYGIRGARTISSSFSVELLQIYPSWRRSFPASLQGTAPNVNGITALATTVANFVKSSLKKDPPANRNSSITYDPIGDDPSSFSKPLPVILRKILLSILIEINSGSESVLKFAALIDDSRITRAVEPVLNAIKDCYKSADSIFGAPDAPQILSSTRGLLFTLHQALHEHLHACHGIQGARMISSSFFKRLPQIFLRWERDIRQTTAPDVHGIIILTTSITNLLKSSLNGSPPVHRASSITYNPIRKDPSSFFIPLLALIRNVVLSVLSEINSRSESILELSALIEDSRVTGAVKSVLNAIKNCYTWVDDIFCATDAPQVLSSTRGLLSMLHWALHEHLHAYYGIQGARIISSSFSEELPRVVLTWRRSVQKPPRNTAFRVDGIITATTSITNLVKSSLKGSPSTTRNSITYDRISDNPNSYSIPLSILIRKVVTSVLNEIESRSESILKLTTLIEDSRITEPVKSVLNSIETCYTSIDDIFCGPRAPQIVSSTRGLLSTLHQALHEHLHARYGIQGARIISSSFFNGLPQILLAWERNTQTSSQYIVSRADGIITLTTSISNLVKSSLKGGPSTNRNSITYDRISDAPNLFSIPLPTLIRKVVISVLNDIDSRSESILKLTALTEDSRMAAPVKSILAAMKTCYASVDDIFCAPHAPQILSTTRGLLSTLHQALHEHLHARYGIRGARMISSSFVNELPQIFLSWKRNVQTSSQNTASALDGIVALATSITNLVKLSLKGNPSTNRSSITYDRISIGPNLFYIPLPTLIRKVVIAVLNEIDSRSESILKLTTLIEDPIITGPINFILNVIKTCYTLVDDIFCAPHATQILSSTRGLLSMLHQALHEHLHACYGIQGARIISSNFSKEFPCMFPLWEQSIRMSSQNGVPHVDIIILTTGVTNLLASSLKPHSPDNQYSSITYDPIGNDPSSFSIPLPTLIRKVVISVLNEIDSKSESILKLTTLIEDSRITEPVKSVLNSIKTCYTLVDDIFCTRDAPQILSSTRGFLSTLHQALHEHLHACYGVQGARIISSSFLNGLPQIFLSWEQNILMFSQNPSSASAMDGIITLITSITNLVKSSLNGNPPVHRDSSIIYDPIDNNPSSFSIPLPTLIRKVVLSMLNEIDSRSELILKLAALIQDSRVMRTIKSVLNVIKNRYKSVDDIFCAPHATKILSSTRGLLSMLHQAVHDHLYACYGIQGARIISSNFSKELRRMFLFREQNIRMSSQNRVPHVGGIITLTTSVRNLLESSLRPNPPENRNPSIIYVPIGNDPGTSFIPVPTLMRKVVISVQDEICSRSESISTFTILIEHSRIPEAVKCVLSAIRNSYWGDDIFCAPGAPQILSSTQGLLTTLHGAPNEHLRACYGVQRARIILRSFSSGILSLVLSPNGRHLISAPLDASRIVNVATGALLGELEEHTGLVRSVAYSSDGLHLAPSSGDPTVRIYDAASLRKSKGHTNNVLCETFSPNRSHLASVSSDHTVCTRDPSMGASLQMLQGHTDWVRKDYSSAETAMPIRSFPLRFH